MHAPGDAWTYGFAPDADVRIEDLELAPGGMRFTLQAPFGRVELISRLMGRHNAQNLAGAAAVLATLGHDAAAIERGLAAVRGVAGRLERVVDPKGRLLVVDYAHSPDALEHALRTVREIVRGQVVVVFGCGGDRDAGKRPQMGQVAEHLADVVVVTNDNPRSEEPQAIADAIVAGLTHPGRAHVVLDRAAAIRRALAEAGPGDAVLVAGKGHETYQEQDGVRRPFDDRAELRAALEEGA
jgi:UDP-N-acetylmuramoyl-L-alanyl-D-glutamate--2,6-diaminopimelate ligase